MRVSSPAPCQESSFAGTCHGNKTFASVLKNVQI